MRFLDPRGVVRRHDQRNIAERRHLAAIAAEQAYPGDAELAGGLQCHENVGGIAGCGNAEQAVAPAADGADLARKHLFVAIVVADAGERRGIRGQGDRSERIALCTKPSGQLGGDVLAIGGGTAVAAEQQLASAAQRIGDRAGCCREDRLQPGHSLKGFKVRLQRIGERTHPRVTSGEL